MLTIYTDIENLIMHNYIVLMRDKNGIQVKVGVKAKNQKQAELLAEMSAKTALQSMHA